MNAPAPWLLLAAAGSLVVALLVDLAVRHRQGRAIVSRLSLGSDGDGVTGDGSGMAFGPARTLGLFWHHRWLDSLLCSAGIALPPGRSSSWWWRASMGSLATGVVAAGFWGGPGLVIVVVVAIIGGGAMTADLVRGRAARLVDGALPELVDRVAASARAGEPLRDGLGDLAVMATGPLHDDLCRLAEGLAAGLPLTEALVRWRARRSTPGVRLVVAALVLSADLGGRARSLEGVASTLRDRLAVERELRAASAQARASIGVMVGAPVAFLAFNALRDPGSLGATFGQPIGVSCLVGALVLDGSGAWWMARTIRGVR